MYCRLDPDHGAVMIQTADLWTDPMCHMPAPTLCVDGPGVAQTPWNLAVGPQHRFIVHMLHVAPALNQLCVLAPGQSGLSHGGASMQGWTGRVSHAADTPCLPPVLRAVYAGS